MINSGMVGKYLDLLEIHNLQNTLALIDADPMLSVKRYDMNNMPDGYRFGALHQLCVVNASKGLHSPQEPHQMLAKGIVYVKQAPTHPLYAHEAVYALVSMPYVKFYNSFEGAAVNDVKAIAHMDDVHREIIRKMDGTLISRFIYEGTVYFATRGRIINLDEDNDFWKLLDKVIEAKEYNILLDPNFLPHHTIIGELVGPSNVIVEFHPEDDLVITGMFDIIGNNYKADFEVTGEKFGLNVVEKYDTAEDPDAFVKSWTDVREGVILNFVQDGKIITRVKIKQEAYLNLVRAKNAVSKENLIEMIIENRFKTWDEVENHLTAYLGESAFFEEMMNFYKTEWATAIAAVEDVRKKVDIIAWVAGECKKETVRKNQFFLAKKLLDGDEQTAGLVLGLVYDKYDEGKLVEIMFNRAKK